MNRSLASGISKSRDYTAAKMEAGPTVQVREDTFTVKTYECQPDGSIKLHVLMQHLQEVAATHAEQLGFGYNRLNQISSYWVLSNFRIEIDRLPRWNDEVTIRTWPSGSTRVIATREFIGQDSLGAELFRAGSEWMVLDRQKNRPKNLLRLGLDLPTSEPKALAEKLNRLEPRNDYSEVQRVRVPHSSIDLNGHVNNTEYVRWSIDALRTTFEFKRSIRSMQATYLSEVFEGDELELLLSGDQRGCFRVLGRRPSTQSNVYLMEIGF
jgi:medium-chain acyl-[acyl-carrier-protein] hydrolase